MEKLCPEKLSMLDAELLVVSSRTKDPLLTIQNNDFIIIIELPIVRHNHLIRLLLRQHTIVFFGHVLLFH